MKQLDWEKMDSLVLSYWSENPEVVRPKLDLKFPPLWSLILLCASIWIAKCNWSEDSFLSFISHHLKEHTMAAIINK